MHFPINKKHLLHLAAAALLFGGAPAIAQQSQTTPGGMPQMQGEQAATYTDSQIDAYADSAIKVSQIHGEMAPQIQAAQSDAEKNQVFSEMQQRMMQAVKSTDGITVEQYNQISMAAQQNPQLANRIRAKVESRMQ